MSLSQYNIQWGLCVCVCREEEGGGYSKCFPCCRLLSGLKSPSDCFNEVSHLAVWACRAEKTEHKRARKISGVFLQSLWKGSVKSNKSVPPLTDVLFPGYSSFLVGNPTYSRLPSKTTTPCNNLLCKNNFQRNRVAEVKTATLVGVYPSPDHYFKVRQVR